MNIIKHLSLAALLATAFTTTLAAEHHDHAPAAPAATPATDMTEGEIRKIDADNQKLTIRHGEIKNLGMPGMTMVFRVGDPAMLGQVKVGDKVRFRAEKGAAGFVVTLLQSASS